MTRKLKSEMQAVLDEQARDSLMMFGDFASSSACVTVSSHQRVSCNNVRVLVQEYMRARERAHRNTTGECQFCCLRCQRHVTCREHNAVHAVHVKGGGAADAAGKAPFASKKNRVPRRDKNRNRV